MLPRLHIVTHDDVLARSDFVPLARDLLATGGPAVAMHLRGHRTAAATLYAHASDLAVQAEATGALLLINDRLDIALACSAGGVHLGERAMSSGCARRLLGEHHVLGRSVHSAAGAEAVGSGTDYVFLGSIRRTASHPEAEPLGLEALAEAARRSAVPVLAIGGMRTEDADAAIRNGAWGIAMIAAIWQAKDPVEALRRGLDAVREATRGSS